MAEIYGKASCVVIWLGEAAADGDRALGEIRLLAGDEPTKSLDNDTKQQTILALLKRRWFQRIWVRVEILNRIGSC
jgi:hypothetical protein